MPDKVNHFHPTPNVIIKLSNKRKILELFKQITFLNKKNPLWETVYNNAPSQEGSAPFILLEFKL